MDPSKFTVHPAHSTLPWMLTSLNFINQLSWPLASRWERNEAGLLAPIAAEGYVGHFLMPLPPTQSSDYSHSCLPPAYGVTSCMPRGFHSLLWSSHLHLHILNSPFITFPSISSCMGHQFLAVCLTDAVQNEEMCL